jgi:cytochrome b pre-mRNA-processing protein 3
MLKLFSRKRTDGTIESLYGAIVAQARQPAFYNSFGVPDTLDGRFDMLVLHVALFFRRTRREADAVRDLGQAVFDRFCSDMESSLREIGIGDTKVPKEMRRMGEAFYGRASAYEAALTQPDDAALAAALARNILRETSTSPAARRLAGYVRCAASALAEEDSRAFLNGAISFPAPEESGGDSHATE